MLSTYYNIYICIHKRLLYSSAYLHWLQAHRHTYRYQQKWTLICRLQHICTRPGQTDSDSVFFFVQCSYQHKCILCIAQIYDHHSFHRACALLFIVFHCILLCSVALFLMRLKPNEMRSKKKDSKLSWAHPNIIKARLKCYLKCMCPPCRQPQRCKQSIYRHVAVQTKLNIALIIFLSALLNLFRSHFLCVCYGTIVAVHGKISKWCIGRQKSGSVRVNACASTNSIHNINNMHAIFSLQLGTFFLEHKKT